MWKSRSHWARLARSQAPGLTTTSAGPVTVSRSRGSTASTTPTCSSSSYTEQGNQGQLSTQQTGLQAVQNNFPEPSTTGISAS